MLVESRYSSKVGWFYWISPSLLNKWKRPQNRLITEHHMRSRNRRRKRAGLGRPARFPEQEDLLYMMFYNRRVYKGLRVSHRWLQLRFRLILMAEKPEGWETFKYSNCWSAKFCKRYRISDQAKTNKKLLPLAGRLP